MVLDSQINLLEASEMSVDCQKVVEQSSRPTSMPRPTSSDDVYNDEVQTLN